MTEKIEYPKIYDLKTPGPDWKPQRKFRWTFNLIEHIRSETGHEIEFAHDAIFVKLQHRPFQDQELKSLNDKPVVDLSYIKDEELRKKLEKQVFNILFFRDDPNEPIFKKFYRFVGEIYDLDDYESDGKLKEDTPLWNNWGCALTLYDGCGNPLERWTMKEIRPLSINFGELDHDSSSEVAIEATIMYQEVNYLSLLLKEGQPGHEATHQCLEERLKEMYRKLHK